MLRFIVVLVYSLMVICVHSEGLSAFVQFTVKLETDGSASTEWTDGSSCSKISVCPGKSLILISVTGPAECISFESKRRADKDTSRV